MQAVARSGKCGVLQNNCGIYKPDIHRGYGHLPQERLVMGSMHVSLTKLYHGRYMPRTTLKAAG